MISSCTSVVTRSKMSAETRYKEDFIYYTGTRLNYEVLSNDSEKKIFLRYLLGVPDMPLSMIMDTALIPLDFMVHMHEKTKESEPKTEMEQLVSDTHEMLALLSQKKYDEFKLKYVDKSESQTSLFEFDFQALNESNAEVIVKSLTSFIKDNFSKPSYERGGRNYFKGKDYLVSFKNNSDHWVVSTLSQEFE